MIWTEKDLAAERRSNTARLIVKLVAICVIGVLVDAGFVHFVRHHHAPDVGGVHRRASPSDRVFAEIACGVFIAVLLYLVVGGLVSGMMPPYADKVRTGVRRSNFFGVYSRDDQPISYWAIIVASTACAILLATRALQFAGVDPLNLPG